MSRTLRYDRQLAVVILALMAAGLVMIYNASSVVALKHKGDPMYFFTHQAVWMVVGIAALLVGLRIPYTWWRDRRVVLTLLSAEFLLLVVALFMPAINGSHRWIRVWKMTLQPSESAKLVLVIFAAYLIERKQREGRDWVQTLVPLAAVGGLASVLILLQPDLGTVAVLWVILGSLLFATGLPWKWIAPACAGGFAVLLLLIVTAPYRLQRLLVFLNPGADPQGKGFQAQQSLIAVGSGGLFGKWFDGASQKLMFLPEPHTDFIYAMVGETFGLLGCAALLGLFLWLGYRGFRAVKGAPDEFGALLAVGLTTWILGQALIHIMVTLCLLPTKGLPLPLFSYGGSNLVVTLSGLGILLNVSQHE